MKIIIMTHIHITILYIHIHIHTYVHITVLYRNKYLIEIGADIPSEAEDGDEDNDGRKRVMKTSAAENRAVKT